MLKNKLSINCHTRSSFDWSDTFDVTTGATTPKMESDSFSKPSSSINKCDILKQVIKNLLINQEGWKLHLQIEHFSGFSPYQKHLRKVKGKNDINEQKKGNQILSISKWDLIEKVMGDYQQNSSIYYVLLYTYKWYFDDKELFEGLLSQFKVPLPLGLSPAEKKVFLNSFTSKVQIKVLSFLKDWIKCYKQKFYEDPILLEVFLELIYLMITHPDVGPWIQQPISQLFSEIENVIQQKETKSRQITMNIVSLPEIFLPYSVIIGYSHLLAKQLCIFDLENLKAVQIPEFLNKAWSKEDKQLMAPNLTYIAEMSTRLSRLTSYLILMNRQSMVRGMLFQFFVDLCEQLINLKNFNSALAIYLGLASNSVQRLKGFFEPHVNQTQLEAFEKMHKLFSPNNNMEALRNMQNKAEVPMIPYLGVYLSDIFFLEESPNYIGDDKEMLNFNKFQLLHVKINRILACKEPNGFHRVDMIINYLKGIPFISEELIYDLSDRIFRSRSLSFSAKD